MTANHGHSAILNPHHSFSCLLVSASTWFTIPPMVISSSCGVFMIALLAPQQKGPMPLGTGIRIIVAFRRRHPNAPLAARRCAGAPLLSDAFLHTPKVVSVVHLLQVPATQFCH